MHVTLELRAWLAEQFARGCRVEDLIEAMVTVGHDAEFARATVLGATPAGSDQTAAAPATRVAGVTLRKVPEPLLSPLSTAASCIDAGDREISVLANFFRPRVILLGNVLSAEECDALIAESRPKLSRSYTVDRKSGENELNAARTSEGTYFHHDESALLTTINARIERLTGWPRMNGEPLQILHYGVGAQYEPHYDYFDPADPGTQRLTASGGQRVATLIIYLNTPSSGGATIFPDLEWEVAARQGNAVFFSYDRADPASRTLHGGTPVVAGEKWIATRWMREGAYR